MSIYDDLVPVVQGVLSEFKQGVIEYGAVTSGAGSIDEPGPSSVDYVVLNGAVSRGVMTKYVMRGLAVASDQQVTFAPQANVDPKQKDFVRIDGVVYKIEEIDRKPRAGTAVAYTLIVRR